MTGTELDEILASDDTQEPSQEVTTDTPETQEQAQSRDENGRFAAKAEAEQSTEQAEDVQEHAAEEENGGKVPQQALHASRQKEKEARAEAEQLRREMAEMRGQIQMLSQRPQTQQTPAEQEKPLEIWDDPDAFVRSQISPLQKQMQQQSEQFSKMLASQEYGKETVDGAYKAFVEAAQANPGAYASEYKSIMGSQHPYDALVQWHKRQQTLQTVGNDPNAWLEAEMEKRLADPAYQAKVMERIKASATANTSRSAPVTNLPPSLSRLPAGGNDPADNDTSDAALFSNALR